MRNELMSPLLTMRDFLEPLRRSFSGRDELETFFYGYGWDVPLEMDIFDRIRQRAPITGLLDEFLQEADAVRDELSADPTSLPTTEQFHRLATTAQRAIRAAAVLELSDLTGLPDPLGDAAFWRDIARHVLDDLLEQYLRVRLPVGYFVLHISGVIRYIETSAQAPYRRDYVRTFVDWDQALALVTNPAKAVKEIYAWGDATGEFRHAEFLAALGKVLRASRVRAQLLPPDSKFAASVVAGEFAVEQDAEALWIEFLYARSRADSTIYELGVEVVPARRVSESRVTALAVRPVLRGGADLDLPLGPSLRLKAKGELDAGAPAVVLAPESTALLSGQLETEFAVELERQGDGPLRLLGSAEGSRIEVPSASLALSIAGGADDPEVRLMLKLGGRDGGKVVIALGEADGFVKNNVKQDAIELPFRVEVSWSSKTGLRLNGSTGLDFTVPFRIPLFGAELRDAHVVLRERDGPATQRRLELKVGTTLKGRLGPVEFMAAGLGFALEVIRFTDDELLALPEDQRPMFGGLDLQVGFSPPDSVGLIVEGGGFTGGGFLRVDQAGGEYAGALELRFHDEIHVKAVGILSAAMPGEAGFALVIVISAEFSPIQLGFGLTLIGVGGLIGINRTVLRDNLRHALRDGSLESILFPKKLIENAPQVISDLKRQFPPSQGHYLIGPMAKLGWGTPALATLEFGVIIEIPGQSLVILGVLRIAAPPGDEAVLKLQVNFVGEIDFDKKQVALDATLYDSRFMMFPLTGDLALRVYWGAENANLLATVGGFHPAFTPPPMALPPLERLALSIFEGNPRLRAEAYFAVTSNTRQFGAKLELYYGVRVFSVAGFLSVDALLQFVPFRFVAEAVGSLAVRSGGSTLFAIRLELLLEGPGPWRARGRGSFEIGFIVKVSISASFDVTMGEVLRQIARFVTIAPLIEAALREPGNWIALTPVRAGVALRELPLSAGVLMPPTGTLAIVQNVAPLGVPIQRMGAARVEGASSFAIVDVTVGGAVQSVHPRTDLFAAAQFLDMSDDEKLSRRSFEPFAAGVEAEAASPQADFQCHVDVAYEVVYLRKPRRNLVLTVRNDLIDLFVGMSAGGRSRSSATQRAASGLGTPKVTAAADTFVITSVDNLHRHGGDVVFASETAAAVEMERIVAADRRFEGKLQVVGSYEVVD